MEDAQKARLDRLRRLEPLLTAGGDAGRGRRIFFGPKVACSSCHTIGTEGANVGPDLTGIGAIRSGHDLLEAIVFPSASFVPGHEVYTVELAHDRLSGVIRSQNRDAVVLVTGPNGEVRIPRAEIKSMQPSKVSLMPEGFDESLTKTELTDLLAFLQAETTPPEPVPSHTLRTLSVYATIQSGIKRALNIRFTKTTLPLTARTQSVATWLGTYSGSISK